VAVTTEGPRTKILGQAPTLCSARQFKLKSLAVPTPLSLRSHRGDARTGIAPLSPRIRLDTLAVAPRAGAIPFEKMTHNAINSQNLTTQMCPPSRNRILINRTNSTCAFVEDSLPHGEHFSELDGKGKPGSRLLNAETINLVVFCFNHHADCRSLACHRHRPRPPYPANVNLTGSNGISPKRSNLENLTDILRSDKYHYLIGKYNRND
jgi:hypothetical protein